MDFDSRIIVSITFSLYSRYRYDYVFETRRLSLLLRSRGTRVIVLPRYRDTYTTMPSIPS